MNQQSAPTRLASWGPFSLMLTTMGPDAKRMVQVGVALLLTVLTTCVGDTGAGDPHAPCFNCEIYNLMQHDQTFHDRQVSQLALLEIRIFKVSQGPLRVPPRGDLCIQCVDQMFHITCSLYRRFDGKGLW